MFLLVVLSDGSGFAAQTSRSDDRLAIPSSTGVLDAESVRLFEQGRPDEAIESLSRAVARRPGEVAPALRLAAAYARCSRHESAIALLENLRATHPQDLDVAMALAEAALSGGRPDLAVSVLHERAEQLPSRGLEILLRAGSAIADDAVIDAVLPGALQRFPLAPNLWEFASADALRRGRVAEAIRLAVDGLSQVGADARLHGAAARAYSRASRSVGELEVRQVRHGCAGQFQGEWLLVQAGSAPDRFLCASRESALYHARKALDLGATDADLVVLHARAWGDLGDARCGLRILQAQESRLRESGDPSVPLAFVDLAWAANDMPAFLRYVREAVEHPADADALATACFRAAERFGLAGEVELHRELLRRGLALRADPDALLSFSDALWNGGNRREALGRYVEWLSRTTDHPARGRVLSRLESADTDEP